MEENRKKKNREHISITLSSFTVCKRIPPPGALSLTCIFPNPVMTQRQASDVSYSNFSPGREGSRTKLVNWESFPFWFNSSYSIAPRCLTQGEPGKPWASKHLVVNWGNPNSHYEKVSLKDSGVSLCCLRTELRGRRAENILPRSWS